MPDRLFQLIVVIAIWLVSLGSALLLFWLVDETFAEGEFMGFKIGGGIAGCIAIFLLLYNRYRLLLRSSKKE